MEKRPDFPVRCGSQSHHEIAVLLIVIIQYHRRFFNGDYRDGTVDVCVSLLPV
jgi:hypothetical protein